MELREKLISYLLYERFIGDKNGGSDFCQSLVGYPQANKINEQTNGQYGHPVLEAVCYYFTNKKCDLLEDVNAKLRENDFHGLLICEEDLRFSPFHFHGPFKEPFYNVDGRFEKDAEFRKMIYRKLSGEVVSVTRIIGHFLLPYSKINEIKIDHHNHVRDRAQEVFNKWEKLTHQNKKTWRTIRSLLMFLNKRSLVNQIEGAHGKHSANSNSSSESDVDDVDTPTTDNVDNDNSPFEIISTGSFEDNGTFQDGADVTTYENVMVESLNNNREYCISNEDSTSAITMCIKDATNSEQDPDYDLKHSLIMEDLGQIARSSLATILDVQSPMNETDYVGLARKFDIKEGKVKLLRLYHGGDGCPAYSFLTNLFVTAASTHVIDLISHLENKQHNFPEESVSILVVYKDCQFKDIPDPTIWDLAVILTQLEQNQISDWKILADLYGYSPTVVTGFRGAVRTLGYSPTEQLFNFLDTKHPKLKLVELSEYLGQINNYLAKNKLDEHIMKKIKNIKSGTRTRRGRR